MPYNGSGVYSPPNANFPAVTQTVISSTDYNAVINDIATALTNCVTKDGQQVITADISLNNHKLTNVSDATAANDAINVKTLQNNVGVYVATVGGTADAITLSPSPSISAYATGQTFRFIATGANTGAVTVDVSSKGAKSIVKNGGTALAAGDIVSGALVEITYNGTAFEFASAGSAAGVLTTRGDLLVYGASGYQRLGIGASGQFLTSDGTDVIWADTLIPSGTKMLFQQTLAPTGWTKDTAHNDKALRVVSGSVSSGGTDAFTTVFGSGKTTNAHTLITSETPYHTHDVTAPSDDGNPGSGSPGWLRGDSTFGYETVMSAPTGSNGSHTHNLTLDIQYVDVIIATKD